MKTSNIDKVKEIQSELLNSLIGVFNKYNLKWCIAYGTLLGAIRDGGFISWDHDVDVFMPYADYRKLYELNKCEVLFDDSMKLLTYDSFNRHMRNFKLIRKNTTLATKDHVVGHLFLDIYPILDVNDSDKTIKSMSNLSTEFKEKWCLLTDKTSVDDKVKLVTDYEESIYNLCSGSVCNGSIDLEDMVGYSYKKTKIPLERVIKYIMPKINFDEPISIPFRGINTYVNVPDNPTIYLRKWYGKYEIPEETGEDFIVDTEIDCDYYRKSGTLPNIV